MIAHLLRFDLPLISALTVLLWWLTPQVQWWQCTIMVIGVTIWDWGWHSQIHHPKIWSAHPAIRIFAGAVAVGCPIVSTFFR